MPGIAIAVAPSARKAAGPAASIGLHLLVLGLAVLAPLRPLPVAPMRAIEVEMITPERLAALSAPAAARAPAPAVEAAPEAMPLTPPASPEPTAPAPPQATEPAANTAPGGLVTARQFYAAALLRQPGMARVRAGLATIADSDRVAQLCAIEGLEQIRRAAPRYDPDTIVPYALANMRIDGLTLVAAGGAFRSRRAWYGLSFRCTVTADYGGVEAFAFRLGDAIPKAEWGAHDLNASDETED